MNLVTYPDRDMMFVDLASKIAGEIEAALFHEDTVTLAVPGGMTSCR